MIPEHVKASFGLAGPIEHLPGGTEPVYRAENVVVKQIHTGSLETEHSLELAPWLAGELAHADKEYLLKLEYPAHLWMEKEIKSVANVARADVAEFMDMVAETPIWPEVQEFRLEEANRALVELKTRKIRGAKVLRVR